MGSLHVPREAENAPRLSRQAPSIYLQAYVAAAPHLIVTNYLRSEIKRLCLSLIVPPGIPAVFPAMPKKEAERKTSDSNQV